MNDTESAELALAEDKANQDINIQRLITDGKNPRGIPTAKFIVSYQILFGFLLTREIHSMIDNSLLISI
jgi:hypothetical protein